MRITKKYKSKKRSFKRHRKQQHGGNSPIPKIFIQLSKSGIPDDFVNINKKYINNWKYVHFTNDEQIKYLNENPSTEFSNLINVYNSFNNGANRADLFRYYYLYLNGGVYLDSDAILFKDINLIIQRYIFVSVISLARPNTIFNGFIAVNKNNPIIYEALKQAYNTPADKINNDYFLFTEQLSNILNNYKNDSTIKLYKEKMSDDGKYAIIYNPNTNEELLEHHFTKYY
jgi:mannosyltransferase OCH1-like enzyme